jgi:hypothetical protein
LLPNSRQFSRQNEGKILNLFLFLLEAYSFKKRHITKKLELKIFEKIHAGSEKDPYLKLFEKSDPDPKKIISDQQHWQPNNVHFVTLNLSIL